MDELTRAVAALAMTETARDEALAARDAGIRAALAEGVPAAEIARLTGLSRMRIYQVRDGRR